MDNFIFQNTTKLLFGKGMISHLAQEIPSGKKIMVTFGGGSVKKNGVYDQVHEALRGFDIIEFWGIESNPKIDTLRKAILLGKQEHVDFLLAVGGGSVIDGTKLISAGLLYNGDPWNIVIRGFAKETVPLATVLTVPATGSEMNNGAVISNAETREKYAFNADYPLFSILDPMVINSLPKWQLACGICDTFVHVMEQYMTTTGQSRLMDRWAEGIILSLLEIAPDVIAKQNNYDYLADFMLCATMGLNNFIAMGVKEDWSSHMIGHELTALHGITHGATLSIVLPGLWRTLKVKKMEKLVQFGRRVWDIKEKDDAKCADLTIDKTENFFKSLGLPTRLSEMGVGDETIKEIESRFNERGTCIGENHDITGSVVRQILETCK